jgi:hypothetical protein
MIPLPLLPARKARKDKAFIDLLVNDNSVPDQRGKITVPSQKTPACGTSSLVIMGVEDFLDFKKNKYFDHLLTFAWPLHRETKYLREEQLYV